MVPTLKCLPPSGFHTTCPILFPFSLLPGLYLIISVLPLVPKPNKYFKKNFFLHCGYKKVLTTVNLHGWVMTTYTDYL